MHDRRCSSASADATSPRSACWTSTRSCGPVLPRSARTEDGGCIGRNGGDCRGPPPPTEGNRVFRAPAGRGAHTAAGSLTAMALRRLVLALGCALLSAAPQEPATFDLVLRAGLVVDGHGGPARRADVAIQAGRIVAVGTVPHDAAAAATLDLAGLTLAPGFIDVHAHADQEALR